MYCRTHTISCSSVACSLLCVCGSRIDLIDDKRQDRRRGVCLQKCIIPFQQYTAVMMLMRRFSTAAAATAPKAVRVVLGDGSKPRRKLDAGPAITLVRPKRPCTAVCSGGFGMGGASRVE